VKKNGKSNDINGVIRCDQTPLKRTKKMAQKQNRSNRGSHSNLLWAIKERSPAKKTNYITL
jgi:hypothetical protein